MNALRLRLVRYLLARAIAGLPRRRRDWGEAFICEVDALPPDEQASFAFGGVMAAWHVRVRDAGARPWLTSAIAAVLLGWVNSSFSDVANQASLAVLLTGSAASGYAHPAAWRLVGLGLGLVVPVSGAVTLLVGGTPVGTPHGWTGPIILCLLCIPALLAAYGGATARRRAATRRGPAQ